MDAGIAKHLAKTDLSTLALFSVTHRSSGRMQDNQTGYRRITGDLGQQLIRQAHKRGTRVEVVYTSFGEAKNRKFYGSDKAQSRWIKELVDFTEEQGFDGINVDVELLPADLVPAYGAWVGRLRTALRERLPDAQVSVSTTGGLRGAAMAAAANAAGADRIFLMGYDYHWPGSEPGASAPMDRLDGEDRDLPWSLDRYADLGVPVEKTILGLPLYGYTWPVSGPGIGAPSLGRGDTWVPRRNLRVFEDESFDPEYNATESVEFYAVPDEEHGSWDAVYYDSPRSLTPKLALANERGLAGAGFWAIGYERGLAGLHEADQVVPGGGAAGRQARGVGRSAARRGPATGRLTPARALLAGRALAAAGEALVRPDCSLGEPSDALEPSSGSLDEQPGGLATPLVRRDCSLGEQRRCPPGGATGF